MASPSDSTGPISSNGSPASSTGEAATVQAPVVGDDPGRGPDCYDDQAILLLRIAGVLVALSQSAIAISDLLTRPARAGHLAFLYALNVSVGLAFFALPATRAMRRHWRPIALGFCACAMASVAWISLLNRNTEFLFLTVLIAQLGAGAMLPWSIFWQDALFAIAFIAFAVVVRAGGLEDSVPALHWVAMLTAGAIGHFAAFFSQRHREELSGEHRKIEESEAVLLKALDSIADPLAITDFATGRYIKVNEEFQRLAGFSREEIIGKTCGELALWPERPVRGESISDTLRREGRVRNLEAEIQSHDGQRFTALISSVLVELAGRQCALTVGRDVSELKKAYRELEAAREAALAASRAKSEFLSSMSHEIRTPMNAILGLTDLLGETPLNDEQRRFVETMASNGGALLDLLNSILDLAKAESGKLRLEETDFDLDELVERVAETLSVRAHEKGLEFAVRIAPDAPLRVMGDPLRLRQVLVNLLGNAIKFTERGEVVLTVENERQAPNGAKGDDRSLALRFSVRDTGIGIAPDKCEEIFQNFTQADSSNTRRYGGSGLGLAIAQRLAELMGGRIRVESELKRGSTFYFTARFKPAERPDIGLEQVPVLDGARVLVVEDNASARAIVREMLEQSGGEVVEAGSSEAALKSLAEARDADRPFAIVVVDAEMPGIAGDELIRHAHGDGLHDAAAIVMLTASEEHARADGHPGFVAYLTKPVRRTKLLTAIATALGRPEPAACEPAAQYRREPIADRRLCILLAEDSPDNRLLIEAYLKDLPYELHEAENGELALRRFIERRGDYDLVLMDVQMPIMDGFSAVKKMRAWEQEHNRPSTPIVALTASVMEDDIRRSIDAGCTRHLSKPVKKSSLLAAIRDLTEGAPPRFNANGHEEAKVL